MNWNKLKTFYHIARIGNLTKAAKQLNISQSAISKQISDIEYDLKTRLFTRYYKRLKLTKQGRILLQKVTRAYVEIKSAEDSIRNEQNILQGELKVVVPTSYDHLYLMDPITNFIKQYPDVHLTITALDVPPNIFAGECDVIISTKLIGQPNLIQNFLKQYHLKLYASDEYVSKYGMPKKVEDLDNHRLIGYGDYIDHPFAVSNWLLSVGKKAGSIRIPYMQVNSTTSRAKLAQKGLGIISIPKEHPLIPKLNLI